MFLLFLPAAGRRNDGAVVESGMAEYSTASANKSDSRWIINFRGHVCDVRYSNQRSRGFAIRLASVVSEGLTRQGNASYIFRP